MTDVKAPLPPKNHATKKGEITLDAKHIGLRTLFRPLLRPTPAPPPPTTLPGGSPAQLSRQFEAWTGTADPDTACFRMVAGRPVVTTATFFRPPPRRRPFQPWPPCLPSSPPRGSGAAAGATRPASTPV